MHACLNVDEIVRLIARELIGSGGRGTAVSLACCCKSLEDPVLDALWAKHEPLLKLLLKLPLSNVWNEDECTVSVTPTCVFPFLNNLTRQSSKSLPTTMEWARFQKYAQRIRELSEYATLDSPSWKTLSVIRLSIINGPLLPNLKTLHLWEIEMSFIPFIPLFISPRTTVIILRFRERDRPDLPKVTVASMITTFPTICPNLQAIRLENLPSDPIITTAVSGMFLATNRNTLQHLHVDSTLTEEASGVLYRLPELRSLSVVIEGETPLPSASLPNLTELTITCDNEDNWPQPFHGATLGKLESVTFIPRSEQIGDFLGAFQRAALPLTLQNTLSKFHLSLRYSWNPNYSSLLPFTQLVDLEVGSSCDGGCSSRMDDNIITNLSRAMPKLESLLLDDVPCYQFTTGVTAKGLIALAHNCPKLSLLRVHFQVATLGVAPAGPGISPWAKSTAPWVACALTELVVGETPLPEESVLRVAMTLLLIFPQITFIHAGDNEEEWEEVQSAINDSKRIIEHSSKQHPSLRLRIPSMTTL